MHFLAKPISIILLVSFSFNASGQNITPQMEKDFRIDARIKVSQAVQVINTAVDAYEKSGSLAFTNSLEDLLSSNEKAYLIKELKGQLYLPRLRMEGDKLIVFHKKEIIAQLESYDVAQGIYKGGPFHYTFNNNLGLIENLQNWKSNERGSAQNNLRTLRFLRNLFIPYAEAIKPALAIGVSAIIGALVGWYLKSEANKTKIAKYYENPVSESIPAHQFGHSAENAAHTGNPSKARESDKKDETAQADPQKDAAKEKEEKDKALAKTPSKAKGEGGDSYTLKNFKLVLEKCTGLADKNKKLECLNMLKEKVGERIATTNTSCTRESDPKKCIAINKQTEDFVKLQAEILNEIKKLNTDGAKLQKLVAPPVETVESPPPEA
ncbi:MAG: hypothetical protein WCK43_06195 [bacterium]